MVYTVGRIDIYEPYLDSDPDAAKGKTGTVWKDYESVKRFCAARSGMINFKIYLVEADWDNDTEEVPGEEYRELSHAAKLHRLPA